MGHMYSRAELLLFGMTSADVVSRPASPCSLYHHTGQTRTRTAPRPTMQLSHALPPPVQCCMCLLCTTHARTQAHYDRRCTRQSEEERKRGACQLLVNVDFSPTRMYTVSWPGATHFRFKSSHFTLRHCTLLHVSRGAAPPAATPPSCCVAPASEQLCGR